jgi:hypothetical protein
MKWKTVRLTVPLVCLLAALGMTTGCKEPDSPPFVAVTRITGVPVAGIPEQDLTLSGTVMPDNTTNKAITWMVKDAGTTGVRNPVNLNSESDFI